MTLKSLQAMATVWSWNTPVAVTSPPQRVRSKSSGETEESIQTRIEANPKASKMALRNRCCPASMVIQWYPRSCRKSPSLDGAQAELSVEAVCDRTIKKGSSASGGRSP